ncbi:MAG: GTP-binding protein [Candidatus Lokiarchaeota archaeon]|nr:GTP-binding protein [Candidatus Lokiarchaeota archaeon]
MNEMGKNIPSKLQFKLPIIGDAGVGKTTLTHRYLHGLFKQSYHGTIGVDFFLKKLELNGKNISLQIWDFAGEEKFRFLLPGIINGANGTIFMFDITRYVTFENLSNWLSVFKTANENHNQTVPALLVGSKTDLEGIRTVPSKEAKSFAQDNNLSGYIECSSKNGENVEELFRKITKIMMEKVK